VFTFLEPLPRGGCLSSSSEVIEASDARSDAEGDTLSSSGEELELEGVLTSLLEALRRLGRWCLPKEGLCVWRVFLGC